MKLFKWTVFFLTLGFLLWGVTIDGKHYELTCNSQDGVGFNKTWEKK